MLQPYGEGEKAFLTLREEDQSTIFRQARIRQTHQQRPSQNIPRRFMEMRYEQALHLYSWLCSGHGSHVLKLISSSLSKGRLIDRHLSRNT